MSDDLLDAVKIGAELGVHPVTVRKWMSDGTLRTKKVGNRRVARRAWLDAFIDDRDQADEADES